VGEFVRERLPDPISYFESEGLQPKGPGKWKTARCDFHDGSDSMRINSDTGGWVCMACGAKGGDVLAYQMQLHGQEFIDAARALGAWDEGKPQGAGRQRPLSFPPRAALEVLRVDALHCAVAACNLAQGQALTDADRERLLAAAARIDLIAGEVAR